MINVNKLHPWWKLTALIAGSPISLTVFMTGVELNESLGNISATIAVCLGNAFLLAIALMAGLAGTWKHKSFTECASEVFGPSLNFLYVLILSIIFVFWFGINLHHVAVEIEKHMNFSNSVFAESAIKLILGLGITFLVLFGINALIGVGLATLVTFFSLIGYIFYSLYFLDLPTTLLDEKTLLPISFQGVSTIIGLGIAGTIAPSTFMKQSRSATDSILTYLLTLGLSVPIVELLGVFYHYNYSDVPLEKFLALILNQNIFWLYLLLFFSGVTACAINLYVCVANAVPFYPKFNIYKVVLFFGLISTFFSVFAPLDQLDPVLKSFSIVLTSMGAAIIFEFLIQQSHPLFKETHEINLFAWSIGIFIGLLSLSGWIIISEIPAVDSFMATGCFKLFHLFFYRYLYVPEPEENHFEQ